LSNVSSADLAPDQLAAVTHPGGAARIIAPAGSGKTRVLTERARHLLVGWRLPPSAVSLVAFNKRAQEEMRERTADLPGLQVRTLNAIALAVVNGVRPFLAQPQAWRTIDEPDVRRLLSKLVGFPKRRNTDPVAPWIEALSAIRLGLADPVDVERRYGGDVDGLTEVWPRYRAELERERVVDFDDQIYRAIGVLVGQPEARAAAQRSCRVMLVDEFQDLTPAHLLLVRLLSAPGGAVFGVGDDDQTIYGYNGADPGWLIDFADLFPSAGDHPLEVNYRCPAGVVEAVDRLLRHNRRRVNKTIRAAADEPGGWSVDVSGDPVHATANAVGAAIDAGAAPADVAVLTRVNATLAPVQLALVAAGVPVAGGVGLEFAERTSVRAVLAWLRLTTGRVPFRSDDLAEALRRPSRPLHPRVAEWVAEQENVAALRRLAARLNAERDTDRVAGFADDIERMQKLAGGGSSTGALVHVLLDELGLAGAVQTLDATRQGMNRAAQGDDLAAIRQIAALHEDAPTFERWLRDGLAVARDADGVVLATVHRVKGQEWPHVIVHLADDDQYPHRLADDVEEERRLLHVAITRARRHATIVAGRRPSAFIAELTTEPAAEVVTERPTARPVRDRGVTAPPRTTGSDHPLLDRSTVLAAPGLVLVDQGTEWAVSELDDEAVVAVQGGGATRRFAIGSQVVTVGRQRGALQLPPASARPESVWAYDELRRFRESARNGKPAYVVFDDKTLAAIADALPSTLADLARVKGVGPAKLEQYGDAVLALVTLVTDR
jgi:DNA helicase-2/ATP-dependent DNA helicase PcrA